MSKYKDGDRVLVEARITVAHHDGCYSAKVGSDVRAAHYVLLCPPEIHGLAPKPPTDWSKVEFGARVKVSERDMRFLKYRSDVWPHEVLVLCDDHAMWVFESVCELIEDQS